MVFDSFSFLSSKFDPEFKLVASNYRKPAEKEPIYFGIMDFTESQQAFQRLGLQSAPIVFLFYPNSASKSSLENDDGGGLGKYTQWDGSSLEADGLVHFISQNTFQVYP